MLYNIFSPYNYSTSFPVISEIFQDEEHLRTIPKRFLALDATF